MAYSQALADAVCAHMAGGPSLRRACEAIGVTPSTFMRWVGDRPELAEQYAQARSIGRATRFEALREIASSEPERDERGRIDPGWVAWKRLHIDAEKWSLSKEEPKKYGDKLAIGGAEDLPAIKSDATITLSPEDAYKQMLNGPK